MLRRRLSQYSWLDVKNFLSQILKLRQPNSRRNLYLARWLERDAHSAWRPRNTSSVQEETLLKKISEKLDEVLKRFKDNWEEQVNYMKGIREEMREGRKAEEDGLDAVRYAPFFDMVKEISFNGQKIPKNDEEKIKKTIINIVDIITIEIGKVGLWGNPHKEKHLRALIDDNILYSGIDALVDKKEQIKTDFMKLAKNRTKELTE